MVGWTGWLITLALWGVFLPVSVLWGGYALSPLCFPMIPPTLFRDVYIEVQRLLPSFSGVPPPLVHAGCTPGGVRLRDALFDEACYARCTDAPFLMTSWQDTVAWWACDLSVDMCLGAAQWVSMLPVPVMRDFVASARFYADVVAFGSVDAEYVAAYRMCAVLTLYNVGTMAVILAVGALLLPSALVVTMELTTGLLVFMLDVQAANAA
jgi:hypothetical protein